MAQMTDEQLLKVAQQAVPDHLRPLGRIAVRYDGNRALAAAPHDDLAQAIADEVGATLRPPEPDSADVEFVEHTPLGARSTVVHVRNGKVARVLKRA